jgi:hypothetical protein
MNRLKPESAHLEALDALKRKDYSAASSFFKMSENQFADRLDFRILNEVTDLLLAVKEEIAEIEKEEFIVEEIYNNGQKTELL